MKNNFYVMLILLALSLSLLVGCGDPVKGGDASPSPETSASQAPADGTPAPTQTLKDRLEAAITELSGRKAASISGDMTFKIGMTGLSMEGNAKMSVLFAERDGEKESLNTIEVTMLGQTSKQTTYEKGGKVYSDNGAGLKTVADADPETDSEIDSFLDSETQSELLALLETATVTEENGNTVITIAPSEDKLNSILGGDILGGFMEGLDPQEGASVELKNGKITLTLSKENQLLAFCVEISITSSVEEEGTSMDSTVEITLDLDIASSSTTVTIDAPTDLDSYLTEDELNALSTAVFELFDENGDPVTDYDSQIAALETQYGKDAVEAVLALVYGQEL